MEAVEIERRGELALWTVNRPATRNAVDFEVYDGLCRALDTLGDARAVVLRGAQGHFVSGGDLGLIRAEPFERSLALCEDMGRLLDRLERAPVPVVAWVEGGAYGGGCEVLLACDYVVAHRDAKLSFRQATMGLTTGWGAATRLARRVPRGTAAWLLMSGATIDAREANRLGLVDLVANDPEHAVRVAKRFAAPAPAAVAAFKRVLAAAYSGDAEASRALERAEFATLWGGPSHRAALERFFSRKK